MLFGLALGTKEMQTVRHRHPAVGSSVSRSGQSATERASSGHATFPAKASRSHLSPLPTASNAWMLCLASFIASTTNERVERILLRADAGLDGLHRLADDFVNGQLAQFGT